MPESSLAQDDGGVAEVGGWLYEENLDKFVQYVATYVGCRWDHLDDDALVGALDSTDSDESDAWFQYPIVGVPPVLLALARDVGSTVVSVRLTGEFDEILATRFETLLDLL